MRAETVYRRIQKEAEMDTYQNALRTAQAALHDARALLNAEIADYPGPISGCDAQYNHLLAERHRIGDALNALGMEVFVPTPRTPSPGAGVESR